LLLTFRDNLSVKVSILKSDDDDDHDDDDDDDNDDDDDKVVPAQKPIDNILNLVKIF
jgi:hypothetical protein